MLGLRGGVCFVLLDHFLWAEAPRGKPSAIAGAESTLPNAALARALARSLTVDLEIGAWQSRGRRGPQPASSMMAGNCIMASLEVAVRSR